VEHALAQRAQVGRCAQVAPFVQVALREPRPIADHTPARDGAADKERAARGPVIRAARAYKGFFKAAHALAAVRKLEADGFDTYLRPASAFSTLGWFNDPLLSTTLVADSVDLVNTVIHELTHNRYFAKSDAVFNESFANFVGARGAERFFLSRGDSVRAAHSVARWDDDRLLAAYWAALYRGLDSVFTAHPGDSSRAERLRLRDSVYAAARRTLVDSVAPRFRVVDPRYAQRVLLDNAALLARRIYLTDLEEFERAFAANGSDLTRTIEAVIAGHRRGN
jgi:predicted aminopeptidase